MRRLTHKLGGALLLAALLCPDAQGQPYPNRPVEVIVAYGFQGSKLKSEYSPQDNKGNKGSTVVKQWDVKTNK